MHDIRRRISVFLIIIMCATVMFPSVTIASNTDPDGSSGSTPETEVTYEDNRSSDSWLSGQDTDSIYGDAGDVDLSVEMDEDEKPGVFESLFINLVKAIANSINGILKKGNITLDSIIMGRVDGHGVAIQSEQLGNHVVALFTFELMKGNIFGIISANVYAIIRSIVYIIILCAVFAKIVAAGWKGDSAKALAAFKSAFGEMIVVFMMLQVMPYILDLIFYVRDVILHLLYSGLVAGMGLDISKVSGLSDIFMELADGSILNALMYLASTVITVWFVFQYIGLALSFCIYFFCFPFVCVNSLFAKNELVEWWKSVIGYALVPIGDLVLMFIPAAFGLIGRSFTVSVIQFCVCAMMIPGRSVLRAAMGIRSNFAMEMAAMGALGGAARMAGGTMRAFGKTAAGAAGGFADIKKGEMFEQAGKQGIDLMGSGGGPGAAGGGATAASGGPQAEFLSQFANTRNFEDPEFRGLSNEKRAELYKRRGMQQLAGAAFGGAAGLGGAAIGAGAGMFMGANNAGQMAGAMAESATSAGQFMGSTLSDGVSQAQEVLQGGAFEHASENPVGSTLAGGMLRRAYAPTAGSDLSNRVASHTSAMQTGGSSGGAVSPSVSVAVPMGGDGIVPEVIGGADMNARYEAAMDWNNPNFMKFVNDEYDAVAGDNVSYPSSQAKYEEFNRRMERHATDMCMDAFDQAHPGTDSALRSIQENMIAQKYRATYVGNGDSNRWVELAGMHEDTNASRFEFK